MYETTPNLSECQLIPAEYVHLLRQMAREKNLPAARPLLNEERARQSRLNPLPSAPKRTIKQIFNLVIGQRTK